MQFANINDGEKGRQIRRSRHLKGLIEDLVAEVGLKYFNYFWMRKIKF